MKYIITENKLEKVIIHFLNKTYGNLTEYKTKQTGNLTYYIRNYKIYMTSTLDGSRIYVDEDTIWSDLKNLFSLGDNEIKSFIKKWAEETYNIKGISSEISPLDVNSLVDLDFNI